MLTPSVISKVITTPNRPERFEVSIARSGSELLLLGMRGHIKRLSTKIVISQVLMEGRQEHSKKPDVVRKNLIELFGNLPRIELFARSSKKFEDGWARTGYDVNGRGIKDSLNKIVNRNRRGGRR